MLRAPTTARGLANIAVTVYMRWLCARTYREGLSYGPSSDGMIDVKFRFFIFLIILLKKQLDNLILIGIYS